MTPRGFLDFIAQIRGFDGAERGRRIDEVVEKVILGEVMSQPIETLSKGFKRRVGLAQAMLHDPEVLILDEPTDGLDPNQKHHVRELIREMAADKAIVVSTHILEEVEAVCSRAVIIARGKLLADGTPEELVAQAPNHNAVIVAVETAGAEKAAAAARQLDGVSNVESLPAVNGVAKLRVVPKSGDAIAVPVGDAIRASDVEVREIYVERGALDDVFRNITTGDGGGPDHA